MKPPQRERGALLKAAIAQFNDDVLRLPGLIPELRFDVFIEQLVDSLRRIEYVHYIRDFAHDQRRKEPTSDLFDPLKAAALHGREGHLNEACWLVFLATHFGKHTVDGWRLTRDIYGKLGGLGLWSWDEINSDPSAFGTWLRGNIDSIKNDGISRRFSNHRKYESLIAPQGAGTPEVFETYVNWILQFGDHRDLIVETHKAVGQNPGEAFHYLYKSMDVVSRFGRLAKFDYLTMLGKLGLAPIEPQYAYLDGATGPLKGAKLLFTGNLDSSVSASDMEDRIRQLNEHTNVGMQTLEDCLCNWQKSPDIYRYFRG